MRFRTTGSYALIFAIIIKILLLLQDMILYNTGRKDLQWCGDEGDWVDHSPALCQWQGGQTT